MFREVFFRQAGPAIIGRVCVDHCEWQLEPHLAEYSIPSATVERKSHLIDFFWAMSSLEEVIEHVGMVVRRWRELEDLPRQNTAYTCSLVFLKQP
jgi:hypothetical protein